MKTNANKGWYAIKYINIITIKIFNPRINSEGNNFIEYLIAKLTNNMFARIEGKAYHEGSRSVRKSW